MREVVYLLMSLALAAPGAWAAAPATAPATRPGVASAPASAPQTAPADRTAIVLVAFGTSVPEARKVFDYIDQAAHKRFPGYEIRWAFTSQIIINKLRDEGVVTHNLDEVLSDLKAQGYQTVVFQSLHVVPGQEYAEIGRADAGGLTVAAGGALMTSDQDVDDVVAVIEKELVPGIPNVIVTHGNSNYARYNDRLLAFMQKIQARHSNVVVASVEGQPGPAGLARAAEMAHKAGAVHFVPLMIVSGEHILTDVMGDGSQSWKSIIGARTTTCGPSLGWNDQILAICWGHLDLALERSRSERAKALGRASARAYESQSAYERWKRGLSFWPQKIVLLVELWVIISIGVVIGQMLEVAGIVRWLSILTLPFTRMGGLKASAGPAFLMAFQSGAVANSMLVAARDCGDLNRRQLYTSVLVVSCISMFAHLPTFIPPILVAFGWEGTLALFSVRFGSVFAEIIVVLLASNLVVRRWSDRRAAAKGAAGLAPAAATAMEPSMTGAPAMEADEMDAGALEASAAAAPADPPARPKRAPFLRTVWTRSKRTLRRLLLYMVPTFALMAVLEKYDFFRWLANQVPGLFSFSFLPAQATVIIPAQAVNLYNGAVAAATFLDEGVLTVRQAVVVMLIGTMLTAPIRTLKHALPTYIAVLGARPGTVLAVVAQALRLVFLLGGIVVLMAVWK